MGAGVNVLRIAFQRGAVAGFGLFQFALLKINVAELRVVVRLVEVMNLRLQFLDAAAAVRAGQFKSARGGRRGAIDEKIIQHRRQPPADENEHRPNPFLPPDRVNEHPDLETRTPATARTDCESDIPGSTHPKAARRTCFEIRRAGKTRQSNFMRLPARGRLVQCRASDCSRVTPKLPACFRRGSRIIIWARPA